MPLLSMVLLLDGNSKIGAPVRSNLCYLICLRHLIRSVTVANLIVFLQIRHIFLHTCAACSELPCKASTTASKTTPCWGRNAARRISYYSPSFRAHIQLNIYRRRVLCYRPCRQFHQLMYPCFQLFISLEPIYVFKALIVRTLREAREISRRLSLSIQFIGIE